MPLTCIIVDDEPLAVKLLESFVNKTPGLQLLASFTDSVEAINAIKEQQPNLLLLDIQMPDLNGMELAHMIADTTRIIFTTAFKEYAFESYEVSALDFLLKPIRYNKFLAAIEKAKEWYLSRTPQLQADPVPESTPQTHPSPLGRSGGVWAGVGTIFLRVDGEFRQIQLANVLYVSGMKDYVMFYMEDEKRPLITHLTMKSVEDMLPPQQFMRVNRSYIVALDKIRSVDRNDCIYIGQEIIRVTDAYREAFLNYINSKFPGGK
ncbi:MAG: response regulator transcription factor [Prevotella sp.]|nr:response regulator transcription factor [Prevotella sp.]